MRNPKIQVLTYATLDACDNDALHRILANLYCESITDEDEADRVEFEITDIHPDYAPEFKIYDIEVDSHEGQYGIRSSLRVSFDPSLVLVDVRESLGDVVYLIYLAKGDHEYSDHPVCLYK